MPRASELKRGSIVEIDGGPHIVDALTVHTPSARGAATRYEFRFRNLVTGRKEDRTLKGDDPLGAITVERRPVQFSYAQGDTYVFTDLESFEEFSIRESELVEQRKFLTESTEGMQALVGDGRVLTIEMPDVVELPITQCDPSIRGASATSRTKPATLSTGLVVQVPEYMAPGEVLRIDTRTGKFLTRA